MDGELHIAGIEYVHQVPESEESNLTDIFDAAIHFPPRRASAAPTPTPSTPTTTATTTALNFPLPDPEPEPAFDGRSSNVQFRATPSKQLQVQKFRPKSTSPAPPPVWYHYQQRHEQELREKRERPAREQYEKDRAETELQAKKTAHKRWLIVRQLAKAEARPVVAQINQSHDGTMLQLANMEAAEYERISKRREELTRTIRSQLAKELMVTQQQARQLAEQRVNAVLAELEQRHEQLDRDSGDPASVRAQRVAQLVQMHQLFEQSLEATCNASVVQARQAAIDKLRDRFRRLAQEKGDEEVRAEHLKRAAREKIGLDDESVREFAKLHPQGFSKSERRRLQAEEEARLARQRLWYSEHAVERQRAVTLNQEKSRAEELRTRQELVTAQKAQIQQLQNNITAMRERRANADLLIQQLDLTAQTLESDTDLARKELQMTRDSVGREWAAVESQRVHLEAQESEVHSLIAKVRQAGTAQRLQVEQLRQESANLKSLLERREADAKQKV
eukprot:TRINITY_DN2276_c0_g2_i1.p1 TRINITY_DN2276_c0_g2~~TRINITY_DN2276_c0_g2_i1.p1  ORF type:complete len:518 (+),score=114.93 TRINITY_DN2276_c0_g2_i1:38-1555(+)